MTILQSDVLREHWWALAPNARKLFKILYETQNGVPSQTLQEKFSTTHEGLNKIIGWIGRSIWETGGPGGPWSSTYHREFIVWGSDGYQLKDRWRPVVGELLGHHEKGKTIVLESLWNMAGIVKSLETRVDDIPGDISADLSIEFKSCQQELERLSQDLLKLF